LYNRTSDLNALDTAFGSAGIEILLSIGTKFYIIWTGGRVRSWLLARRRLSENPIQPARKTAPALVSRGRRDQSDGIATCSLYYMSTLCCNTTQEIYHARYAVTPSYVICEIL